MREARDVCDKMTEQLGKKNVAAHRPKSHCEGAPITKKIKERCKGGVYSF